jgi:hypothetical protein
MDGVRISDASGARAEGDLVMLDRDAEPKRFIRRSALIHDDKARRRPREKMADGSERLAQKRRRGENREYGDQAKSEE